MCLAREITDYPLGSIRANVGAAKMSEDFYENEPSVRPSRSIQEVRIDFLLEEEFACDARFVREFASHCNVGGEAIEVASVTWSVTDRHGQADLVVILNCRTESGNTRRALLIEDKISAGAQPHQALRYLQRGKEGIELHRWDDFRTVLVAPSAYVGEKDFQEYVPLERLATWISTVDKARAEFLRQKIREAIEKKNSTGVQIVDLAMTEFRANYFYFLNDFNLRHGTDFTIRTPSPTYVGDTWFKLGSKALPEWAKMRHKSRTTLKAAIGLIELSFPETNIEKMASLKLLLEPGMRLVANGKYGQHTAIEIPVLELSESNPFERERQKLESALCAGERLWRFLHTHFEQIEEIVQSARSSNATS
jgi:hypothetical protein